jgi:serine/threonine protein kinase
LENVLFLDDKSLNIKIIDFGLAFCWENDMRREIIKNGESKKLIGTVIILFIQPDYMSPEMFAHSYDQKCDIWAAGVLLYMLLAGVAPFEGETDR